MGYLLLKHIKPSSRDSIVFYGFGEEPFSSMALPLDISMMWVFSSLEYVNHIYKTAFNVILSFFGLGKIDV